MADVFISYSQGAPEPTQALAADMTKRGYAVWFDTSLLPNQTFWRVIMKRITDAKAVIVIWSPPALDSEWVYGEAKLANAQKKLICVRTVDVVPDRVPIPFNGFNLSLVTDRQKIYDALGGLGVQAEKPAAATIAMPARVATPTQVALVAAEQDERMASQAFEYIAASTDAKDFDAFLAQFAGRFPFFARLCQNRIAALRPVPPVTVPSAPQPTIEALPAVARAEIDAAAENVMLGIEPGMHTAAIQRISLDASQRLMATASSDKTVRLWALPEGRLVRTLRPQIGPGNVGKVFAVALAPNGDWLVAGGVDEDGPAIWLFHVATGSMAVSLGDLPELVSDIKVSADGRRFAAGIVSGGVGVWDVQGIELRHKGLSKQFRPRVFGQGGNLAGLTPSLVFEDLDYADGVYGLTFARDGRLATASLDGHIRLYSPDGGMERKTKASGGARPYGIAFSPDCTRLAVSYEDSKELDVHAGDTLQHLFAVDTSRVTNGNFYGVAWRSDGALAAAGTYEMQGYSPILVWEDGGRGAQRVLPGTPDSVSDLAAWSDGLAFGSHGPALGLVARDGTRRLMHGSPTADMRGKRYENFQVSADGRRVRFGLEKNGDSPHILDLAALSLNPSPTTPADLNEAETRSLPIDGWISTEAPQLAGKPLSLEKYETARSLAIAPDARSFVLGTDWRLYRFDVTGKSLWERPAPATTWGVNLARDGWLILAAYGDGTIRWHRARDGQELLALFVHVERDTGTPTPKGWVLWTPQGHYTCSPGADDLIGWHVNRGLAMEADSYPAATFATTFKKPDIIAKALDAAE